MSRNRVEMAMELKHETNDAYLLSDGTGPESNVWVPKSQCEMIEFNHKNKTGIFMIAEWFAEKAGLI